MARIPRKTQKTSRTRNPRRVKMKKETPAEVVHEVPLDLQKALTSSSKVQKAWSDLTPLARNEWICWITSVKKTETRKEHIQRTCEQLTQGKHRPCCWPGCPHRKKN